MRLRNTKKVSICGPSNRFGRMESPPISLKRHIKTTDPLVSHASRVVPCHCYKSSCVAYGVLIFYHYNTSVIIGLFYSRTDRSPESAAHVHADQWRLDSLHRVWRQVHPLGDLKFKTE